MEHKMIHASQLKGSLMEGFYFCKMVNFPLTVVEIRHHVLSMFSGVCYSLKNAELTEVDYGIFKDAYFVEIPAGNLYIPDKDGIARIGIDYADRHQSVA